MKTQNQNLYIFDILNIVLYFDPETFFRTLRSADLHSTNENPTNKKLNIFKTPEWWHLCNAEINLVEAREWLCKKHPNDSEYIRFVLKNWVHCLTPKWETVKLLLDMKAQGFGLLFTCEIPQTGKDYIIKTFPFMRLFDSGVFSCDNIANTQFANIIANNKGYLITTAETIPFNPNFQHIKFSGVERLRDMFL